MNIYISIYIKTPRRVILGFYLWALKICTPIFLDDEFDYIENSFTKLQYYKPFIQHAKIKAFKIHERKCSPEIKNNKFSINNTLHRYIILPYKYQRKKKALTWELKQENDW